MGRDIEREIAANRSQIGRALANSRRPAAQSSAGLVLAPVPVAVDVEMDLYTRPLHDTLVVGHPDADAHGWGDGGRIGDRRGSWTLQETVTPSLERDGRRAIADALVDTDVGLGRASSGSDVVHAFGIDAGPGKTTGRASWRFDELPDPVAAPDVRVADGRVIATGSTSTTVDDEHELRLDATVTVSDDSYTGDSAIQNPETVAEALRTDDNALRLDEIALGTGNASPTTAGTSLDTETFRRQAAPTQSGLSAIVQTAVFQGEPTGASFPTTLRELAVIDTNGDQVLRAVFGAQQKREQQRLRARSGIRIN